MVYVRIIMYSKLLIFCNANCHLLIDKRSIKVHYLIAYSTYTCALNP